MLQNIKIPAPILFNPLKHYLTYIKDFIANNPIAENDSGLKDIVRELKHLGTTVMDIYTGEMPREKIFNEICEHLKVINIENEHQFMEWVGKDFNDHKIISLSDGSQWILKYHNNETHYVHIFPARQSPHTFRIKANTLKSAILYLLLIGKDYISEDDLNKSRALAGLSPVREVADAEAVTEMIEILRR